MKPRRVAITGVGPVSAIGVGREAFFRGLEQGQTGIRPITLFDTEPYRSDLAAEIEVFDIGDFLQSQKSYLDRSSELAMAAMSLAIRDSGLDLARLDSGDTALLLGTAFGGLETMELFFADFLDKGPRLVKPLLFPHTYANTAISLIAIEFNLEGFHLAFASGAVSGSHALLAGYDRIREGRSQVVFAGGFEAFSESLFAGYEAIGALAPAAADDIGCAPFDARRGGMALGEGAAILVLEDLERAQARGARLYGELVGAGTAGDYGADVDGPRGGRGIVKAMTLAMGGQSGGAGIDYLSAGANGDVTIDRREARAIGEFLADPDRVAVSSIKSMIGETLGAAGPLQLTAALSVLETGLIPCTVNLSRPEPECGLNLVMGHAERRQVHRVLMNTLDPGGSVVSLAVAR